MNTITHERINEQVTKTVADWLEDKELDNHPDILCLGTHPGDVESILNATRMSWLGPGTWGIWHVYMVGTDLVTARVDGNGENAVVTIDVRFDRLILVPSPGIAPENDLPEWPADGFWPPKVPEPEPFEVEWDDEPEADPSSFVVTQDENSPESAQIHYFTPNH